MTDKQIINKKIIGDYQLVAEILELTSDNVKMILRRPEAAKYPTVISALRKIVEGRDNIKEEIKKTLEA